IVDIRDYGIWRQHFGQTGPTLTPTTNATATTTPTTTTTATPTLPGRAYVTNQGSNNVTVIDTTTNTAVGTPIPAATAPLPPPPRGDYPSSPGSRPARPPRLRYQ